MSQNAITYRVVNLLELSREERRMLRRTAAGKWVIPRGDDAGIDAEISAQESQEFQGVRKLTYTESAYIGGIFYYLKIYEPQPTADNLEKVSHYLEAFHRFCELAAWEEAWQVLFIRCDTPTREELHIQLGTWGYYQLRIELYNQLLGKLDNEYRDCICYTGLGNAYDSLGDYHHAIKYHQKRLQIALETGDLDGEGAAYGNLGNAYQSLRDYPLAIKFYEEVLKIALETGDRGGEGRAYGNLGIAYERRGEHSRAIDFLQQGLQIAIEIGDRGDEGAVLGSLGNVHHFLGDYRQAIKFHQKRLQIAQEIGDRRGEANAWFNLGRALARVDEKWQAITAYENARKLFQAMGLDQDVEDCNNSIRDIGMRVVVEPQRFLELPTTPARRKRRKFSRKWQQLRADIGNLFYLFFRWVSRWLRSVFRR